MMKIFLIIFLTSAVILLIMFLLNVATYNGTSANHPSKQVNTNDKKL